jgi:arginyl-tRNA--protein-N-Asp/Glu arginylyltransferase
MLDELMQHALRCVDTFLARETLSGGDDTPCPYLPDRVARSEGFYLEGDLDPAIYRALMDRGFRRSGRVIYRPICAGCSQCIPYRVPVAGFAPTRSQRRVRRRNQDVRVEVGDGQPTDEKFALFQRYQVEHHDGTMAGDREDFERFCHDAPLATRELCYFVGRRLVGVSILDVVPGAVSSVYMYFDPAYARRSLGTFSILWEIADCRERGLAYYYLGYYVPGSRTMAYKARFRPAEILDQDSAWRGLDVVKPD